VRPSRFLHSTQAHQADQPPLLPSPLPFPSSFSIILHTAPRPQSLQPPSLRRLRRLLLRRLRRLRRFLLLPTRITILLQYLHLLFPYSIRALTTLHLRILGIFFLGRDDGAVGPVFFVAVGAVVCGGCEGAHFVRGGAVVDGWVDVVWMVWGFEDFGLFGVCGLGKEVLWV